MAFYQAAGGMWTPFKRVAIGNCIEKGTTIEVAAPYTGTYLIVTSKYAPQVPTDPIVESDTKQVIRWASRANLINYVYSFCSYSVIYAEKDQVIYSGLCEQGDTFSFVAPSYCIYYLSSRKLSHTDIDYIGCTSSDTFNPRTQSAYQWGPDLPEEEDNPSNDREKWIVRVSGNSGFYGYRFPYSTSDVPPEKPLNITDPNKEYIIAILGGVSCERYGNESGRLLGGVNTRGSENGYYFSWADGMSLMYVPESNINSTDNTIYNFLSYSDRQASGLVVDFYKFPNAIENLYVSLGVGLYGMGHLLKVTI